MKVDASLATIQAASTIQKAQADAEARVLLWHIQSLPVHKQLEAYLFIGRKAD